MRVKERNYSGGSVKRKIMVTGGSGFIGANLIEYWSQKYPEDQIINVDCLTYAHSPHANQALSLIKNYRHEYVDISDSRRVRTLMAEIKPDHIIHLAAESHVCRSIEGPEKFLISNVVGTVNLLNEFRAIHDVGTPRAPRSNIFYYVSTDEVFGQLPIDEPDSKFDERSPLDPRSPYAASKACGQLWIQAFNRTYGMDTLVSCCSNNFGPYQHPEKLIPKTVVSYLNNRPMTIHGDGTHVRDWLYVGDHARAIDAIFHKGILGEMYCIGGDMELSNQNIIALIEKKLRPVVGRSLERQHVNTRPTDDTRYAIDTKITEEETGFKPDVPGFERNLEVTIEWYRKHRQSFL